MIQNLLKETDVECCNQVGTPINESALGDSETSALLNGDERTMKHGVIGSLMYIATQTMPDLLVVTTMLASCLFEPASSHVISAKTAHRYLNGTNQGK